MATKPMFHPDPAAFGKAIRDMMMNDAERAKFDQNPKKYFKDLGVVFPPEPEIIFHTNSSKEYHVVIPDKEYILEVESRINSGGIYNLIEEYDSASSKYLLIDSPTNPLTPDRKKNALYFVMGDYIMGTCH